MFRALPKKTGVIFPARTAAEVELRSGMVQHRDLFEKDRMLGGIHPVGHDRVGERTHLLRHTVCTVGTELEEVRFLVHAVIDTAEMKSGTERPDHRERRDAQNMLEFVEQLQRVHRRTVQLVHEREDRDVPAPADLEELAGLCFDTLRGVDDHDHGIHGGQHTIRVLGEILVPRRVQQVDAIPVVVELQIRWN